MNGIIIQQISVYELESSIRKILREELSSLDIPTAVLKPPESLDDVLLSKSEAASLIGISLPTFSNMIKEGRVKPIKIGKRFKFKKNQLLSSINIK